MATLASRRAAFGTSCPPPRYPPEGGIGVGELDHKEEWRNVGCLLPFSRDDKLAASARIKAPDGRIQQFNTDGS